MVIVLQFITLSDLGTWLVAFINPKINRKSWSVSDEHTLVTLQETFHSFNSVNSRNFLPVAHVLCLIVLSSYFEKIEDKCNISICETCKPSR